PFPFHPSYSLLMGQGYFKWGLGRLQRRRRPLVLLFHLTDFAEPLPKPRLVGARSRIYTLSHLSAETKRSRCQSMLDEVRRAFAITDTESLLHAYSAEKRLVLGISTTHETGSALFRGHDCLAAISEERLDRVKFSTQYPPRRSISAVVEVAGVDPKEITDVVVAGLPSRQLLWKVLKGQLRDTFEFHGWIDYFPHFNKALYRAFAWSRSLGYRRVLRFLKRQYDIRPQLHFLPHHLCHAAAAYRTAPFDNALIVTADGVGDDISLTISTGKSGRIQQLHEIPYPHSFGQFYTACTQVLGFRANRHEGKITGLSGFGKVDPELYSKVKATIRSSGANFKLDKRYYSEGIVRGFSLKMLRRGEDLFEALQYRNYKNPLKKLLTGYSREDVSAVFQTLLEEELIALVRPFAEQAGLPNLCLCGGIFANVKANAALFRVLGFENVYVYPHMGDGGLGPGAALELQQAIPRSFQRVYWGPAFSEEAMERALAAGQEVGLRYQREPEIERTVAERLAEKKVVARFNGRMEFGPRALGNRSILYNASEPEANQWLNERLGRTEFMPFAPIVMEDRAAELFENIKGTEHACKFMTIILDCNDWTKERCPAIVHVDGTARPQFVSETINPSMYRILSHYDRLTGVPCMVNTSFNMHEEPIVCSPEDAVRAYLASRLDYLAMGPFLAWLERPDPVARDASQSTALATQ
ncbi:MAG: carbamoyltransferase C-terminal domain-containing protein, partial [Planctomycetota bacterium]